MFLKLDHNEYFCYYITLVKIRDKKMISYKLICYLK